MDNKVIREKIKEIRYLDIPSEDRIQQIYNLTKTEKLTNTTRSYIKQTNSLIRKGTRKKKKVEFATSYGESLVESYLKGNKIEYIKEKTFPDLVNIHTNYNLRFDFYLPKLNTCIEFDGKQHFQYSKDFDKGDRSKVKYRQYLDSLKNNYCENKGIKLVRITYKQYKKVNNILKDILAI